MKKSKLFKLDYSVLSSYLGRSATVVVFALIILLAVGALFLEENDMAHMPITIGVYALDSVRAADPLESLADFAREKGAGDITWRYFGPYDPPGNCDFYLMTSVQAAPYVAEGSLDCSLLATVRRGVRFSRGCVVARRGTPLDRLIGGRVIFTSPISATGYLSPYRALARAGFAGDPERRFEFSGDRGGDERVALAVLYGAYDAGGIGFERLRYLEEHGIVPRGELDVLLEGEPYPEFVLATRPGVDPRKLRSLRERVPLILEKMPRSLRADLTGIGIAGFVAIRDEDIALIKTLTLRGSSSRPGEPSR
jgi:hypothetical protein